MTEFVATEAFAVDVPEVLIHALFRQPQALELVLADAGLPPHAVAMWARQTGVGAEIEQQAGWLSVAQQPGRYKPLLEVAGSHWRAGETLEALPIFRWAYQAWQQTPAQGGKYYSDGIKLLAQWGACLYQLEHMDAARQCWLRALNLIQDEEALGRLAQTIERVGAREDYGVMVEQAVDAGLPGAQRLWQRWLRLQEADEAATDDDEALPAPAPAPDAPGVAVLVDVANLDMVCRDQYGFERRVDYQRLLQAAAQYGPVQVKLAFVPDIPDTLAVQEQLAASGFTVDLLRPKRSHGRIVANADTAMAAYATRWASDPGIGRLELWTGDGDFLRAREAVKEAWPEVTVAFRSFTTGTAARIQALGEDWLPIAAAYLQQPVRDEDEAAFRYQGRE